MTCSKCDRLVCSDCLYDHPQECEAGKIAEKSDPLKLCPAPPPKQHLLTEDDRKRIDANKAAAIVKKAVAMQELISNKKS